MRSDLHTHCGEGINRDMPTEQTVSDIGRHCNEITIEELCDRARRGRRGLQGAA